MMEDTEDREMMEHHEEKELSFKIVSKDDDQRARPGRRTSKVWQVFNRLDQSNAQCSICSRVLSFKSSVTNLSKHIQRKHTSAYMSMCSEEDPREGLKEFITIDGHREGDDDDIDDSGMRADDSEWAPPSKLAKKATPSKKVVKKEVISSNGVDYVIYTQDHTPKPTLARAAKKIPVTPPSRTIANLSSMKLETVASVEPPQRRPVEEDEFTTFAKFLSQRIRTLKSPYWQSCAINEINSALHRVEMRCYEVPKVDSAQRYSQTDPLGLDADASSINDANPLEEVAHAEV